MKILASIILTISSLVAFAQVKNPFDIRYQTTVRGDLTMISNSIVGKTPTSTAYNLTGTASESNQDINMQYIDADTDASTFNSSSAQLTIQNQNCSRIVYAGLYWSATYRYEIGNNATSGRFQDWNQVKFKVPGGNYQTITANEVLYNGFADPNQTNVEHGPYACYADVTSLVANLLNPNGDYFVGNIRVSQDGRVNQGANTINGGVSGGWSLVIVYENILLPGKKITTFDGYAVIASGMGNLDIPVSGFITLPSPSPVNAKLGLIALEGDNKIIGDQLLIKSNTVSNFTSQNNAPSSASPSYNNFFNSSITLNGAFNSNRNPNSLNTLGWDSHLNRINNPLNTVLPNNETGATLRATSTGDKYDIFFASFDVEIIEPKIDVLNTAESISGMNISGQNVTMGEVYFYNIAFQNTGNDDANNFTISDVLPSNVIFPISGGSIQPGDIILPNGITYTYNPVLRKFIFTIPNNMVVRNYPSLSIKIKVKVENDCSNLEESCSNVISNQVFSSYQGMINPMIISNNPSSSAYDFCLGPISSTTNIIVDINQCYFSENKPLCAGSSLDLTAPNGYQSYSWTFNGNSLGNSQTINVTNFGTYTVAMSADSPCLSTVKTYTVNDCTLTNNNFSFSNFKIYPNPTKNNLTISNEFAIDEVEITSILGQKMITKKVNDLQTTIDTSELSNGIYFVKVSSQGNEKTVKIVKE